jgi:hypothetical protein
MTKMAQSHNGRPVPPVISSDFLTGSTQTDLERIRTRLLDLAGILKKHNAPL